MALTTAALIWLATGVFLLVLEMVLPGFVLFFFGLGALVTFLCSWLLHPSLNVQLLIFLVSSLALLFTLRGFIKRTFLGGLTAVDEDAVLSFGGESVLVIKTIDPPREGKVKHGGTFWRAVAEERIEEGTMATVVSQENLIVSVKKL